MTVRPPSPACVGDRVYYVVSVRPVGCARPAVGRVPDGMSDGHCSKEASAHCKQWVGTTSRGPTGARVLEGVFKLPLARRRRENFGSTLTANNAAV